MVFQTQHLVLIIYLQLLFLSTVIISLYYYFIKGLTYPNRCILQGAITMGLIHNHIDIIIIY